MENPRSYFEIELILNDILRHYDVPEGDPLGLMQKCNLSVLLVEFDGTDSEKSGYMMCENGKVRIRINVNHASIHQRRILAHELGHYFLGHLDQKKLFVIDDTKLSVSNIDLNCLSTNACTKVPDLEEEIMEIEANCFAICLLMPKKLVEQYWDYNPDPAYLARNFQVSREAMINRLQFLKLL